MSKDTTCSVAECDRTTFCRGWCKSHYQRWYNTGKTPTGPIAQPKRLAETCAAPGCTSKPIARDYCNLHYQRLQTHGRVDVALKPNWAGDEVTYVGMHKRLRTTLGRAANQTCAHCGKRAQEWAYDHNDAAEQIDDATGCAFSTDTAHYKPLCKPCHRQFDADETCPRGHRRTKPGGCRECRRTRDREDKRARRAAQRADAAIGGGGA